MKLLICLQFSCAVAIMTRQKRSTDTSSYLDTSSGSSETSSDERSLSPTNPRTRRAAAGLCAIGDMANMGNPFQVDQYGDTMKIDFGETLFDTILSSRFCTSQEEQREMDNEIYVTNIVDHHQRRKRETPEPAPVKKTPSGVSAPGAHIQTSPDNIRMIERLAVAADELKTKLDIATAALDKEEIKNDRNLFLQYKQRMQSLLKNRLELVVKEHMVTMDELEKYQIPDAFHR